MKFLKNLFRNKTKNQADLISVWIEKEDETNIASVTISNQSDQPIFKIILSTVNAQNVTSSGKDTPADHRTYLANVPPGKFYTKILSHHGMHFLPGIEIAFTDNSGNSWVRNSQGEIKKIHQFPHEYYNLVLPVSWELPLQTI